MSKEKVSAMTLTITVKDNKKERLKKQWIEIVEENGRRKRLRR